MDTVSFFKKVCTLTLVLLWTGVAYGQSSKIASVFSSPGCGTTDFQTVPLGPGQTNEGQAINRESLEVTFFNFSAFIREKGIRSADCYLEAVIRIAAGKRFRAVSTVTQGTYSMGREGQGDVRVDYQVAELESRGQSHRELSGVGDFSIATKLENRGFTSCSDVTKTVKLTTVLTARVWSENDAISEIVFDQHDANTPISWNWQWMDCGSKYPSGRYLRGHEHITIDSRGYISLFEKNKYTTLGSATKEQNRDKNCNHGFCDWGPSQPLTYRNGRFHASFDFLYYTDDRLQDRSIDIEVEHRNGSLQISFERYKIKSNGSRHVFETYRKTFTAEGNSRQCEGKVWSGNDHCYVKLDSKRSFWESQGRCSQRGGHLVTINSYEEDQFIVSEFWRNQKKYYWIGFTDEDREGRFQWITNESVRFQNWSDNEPNDGGDRGEDCAVIHESRSGKWDDKHCDSKRRAICEIPRY